MTYLLFTRTLYQKSLNLFIIRYVNISGFVPKPEMQERVFVDKSKDEVMKILQQPTLTVDELELQLETAGKTQLLHICDY